MSFLNNGFMSALGKIADMLLLSILFLVCSLPVITVVPSAVALYYATVKVVRRDRGYVVRDFFRGFAQSWRQGIALELLGIFLGLLLHLAETYATEIAGLTSAEGKLYYLLFLAAVAFLACVTAYLLPVISRFRLSLLSALRLALSFSFGNLLTLVPLLLTFAGAVAAVYMFPPSILVLPSAYCFLLSFSVERVLVRYMKEYVDQKEEHKDMWYMEE